MDGVNKTYDHQHVQSFVENSCDSNPFVVVTGGFKYVYTYVFPMARVLTHHWVVHLGIFQVNTQGIAEGLRRDYPEAQGARVFSLTRTREKGVVVCGGAPDQAIGQA